MEHFSNEVITHWKTGCQHSWLYWCQIKVKFFFFSVRASGLSSKIILRDWIFKPEVENILKKFCRLKQRASVGWFKKINVHWVSIRFVAVQMTNEITTTITQNWAWKISRETWLHYISFIHFSKVQFGLFYILLFPSGWGWCVFFWLALRLPVRFP